MVLVMQIHWQQHQDGHFDNIVGRVIGGGPCESTEGVMGFWLSIDPLFTTVAKKNCKQCFATAVPWSGGSRFYKPQPQNEEHKTSCWRATQRGA